RAARLRLVLPGIIAEFQVYITAGVVSGLQVESGILEIEFSQRHRSRPYATTEPKTKDVVGVDHHAGRRSIGQFWVTLNRRVLARRICQYEAVAIRAVLEVPPDPLFLHQPANEVVIGLAVLNTIFPRGIGPLEVESNTIGLNSASREDLADDLGDAQSL